MIRNNLILLSTIILFISACSTQPSSNTNQNETVLTTSISSVPAQVPELNDSAMELKRIRINHHKVECEGYWIDQCLQIQELDDDEWHYLYEDIEGFDFVWGHSYELLVEVQQTPVISDLADQSTIVYRLNQVLSDIPQSDASFVYSSRHPSTTLTKQEDGGFTLLDGKKISCAIDGCLSIESATIQQQGVVLLLKHDANPDAPLILEAVLCSSSLPSFADDCATTGH